MRNDTLDHNQCLRICCGNESAISWIVLGHAYVHEIDDLIDEDHTGERVCRVCALALQLYTHPFFMAHQATLASAMMVITNSYADSVRWEKETDWKAGFSDWARHGWIDVVLLVAFLCGGYQHMRNQSLELRSQSYHDHHHDGKVV